MLDTELGLYTELRGLLEDEKMVVGGHVDGLSEPQTPREPRVSDLCFTFIPRFGFRVSGQGKWTLQHYSSVF